jgi:ATP-dependent helicase HepA
MLQPGQRVVNEAEPDLGLGVVCGRPDRRTLEVWFPATEQRRTYRLESAPLRRLVLRPGQEAVARDGRRLRVERVETAGPLLVYHGQGISLLESELEDRVPLGGALERLRAGHVGLAGDLELRRDGWRLRAQALARRTLGLQGARVRLLDHQLYIAHRVSRMELPRVLLADEVGLGKTIEAGLIFSALRALGRAGRVLVLVPESLVHQWLAEWVRRFHQLLSLVTAEAVEEGQVFDEARRALVSLEFLLSRPDLVEQACALHWDLVVVDEAHHLQQGQPAYAAVERLSRACRGLLLLTATPERGGLATEYGLLRLVDPDRYSSFSAFLRERPRWRASAQCARVLHELGGPYRPEHEAVLARLLPLFPEDHALAAAVEAFRQGREETPEALLDALVDRHGPGRVLFRNRRERLAWLFPGRRLHPVPLPDPGSPPPQGSSLTELLEAHFALRAEDARLEWLTRFLDEHPEEKVLLITRSPATVLEIQERLRLRRGPRAAVFHEGLSLVERDRQAAWFADPEGAQVLLCSEIGSEGRNFQFARHLVLFDLPLHPDVVEQRIGRLDRIGQKHPVEIHCLYFQDSPSHRLFLWHHEGLDSFSGPVEGAEEILARLGDDLFRALRGEDLEGCLQRSRRLAEEFRQEARENVDILVDLNSFREEEGRALRQEIEEAEARSELPEYLGRLLDRFGVLDEEMATPGLRRIRPGDLMFVDSLPGLPRDGMLATFSRELALIREDVELLSADHPLVKGAMSLLLEGGEGTAAALRWRGAPRRGLLVQMLFVLEPVGPPHLELLRYLAPQPLVLTLDLAGRPWTEPLPPPHTLERLTGAAVGELLGRLGDTLDRLAETGAALAEGAWAPLRQAAVREAERLLGEEQDRLEELARVNPAVPAEEVEAHRRRTRDTLRALRQASPLLDAVRLVLLEP